MNNVVINNNIVLNIHKCLGEHDFNSYMLHEEKLEFLCHMIILCLTFEELASFYKVTIFILHFTFPLGNFPHLFQHLVSSLLFIIIVMLLGEKWCLIVLICISLCLLNQNIFSNPCWSFTYILDKYVYMNHLIVSHAFLLLTCKYSIYILVFRIQFSSVQLLKLCLTLCEPMKHSMPGLPVHRQLPESTQTHVH